MEKKEKRSRLHGIGIRFSIDILAWLTFVICTVSGWVLMATRHGEHGTGTGLPNAEVFWRISLFEWQHLHTVIGWVFVVLVVVHLIMHWRWISRRVFVRGNTGASLLAK